MDCQTGRSRKAGDIVAVVETQKGAIEIEIFETGRIEQMLVDVGTKVPVGTALARIRLTRRLKGGLQQFRRSPYRRLRWPPR